ncbi:MAG TPA: MFS transporter [Kofleriaceae bacterium]|nr:MFS transporter [Kofleriaceae bacterium]
MAIAIALSPAHRAWRIQVFAATWLSYVGFYFCRVPFSKAKGAIAETAHWDAATLGNVWAAYLVAYAFGQWLASQMGPRLGPRRNVLLGMGVSVAVTVAMGVTLSAWVMAGLVAVNGLAQATGWSGNVGTMASWFHKHERGTIMGIWSTNYTVGAIGAGLVMAAVLDVAPWPWCFFVGAASLAGVWLVFFLFQRNRPEDVGLAPIEDPVGSVDEPAAPESDRLSRDAWINLLLIGGFYFFAKFIRYGLWSWAAFFLKNNYHLSDSRAAAFSTTFDIVGVPGVALTGWLSDRYFGSRRGGISLIMILGMVVATALLMTLGGTSVSVFVILLAAVGFTLYGPDALLTGAGAMDLGSRRLATFATAAISAIGSFGAVVQELLISRMYDPKQDGLVPIFAMLFGSATAAALFCGALVWRNRRGGKGI